MSVIELIEDKTVRARIDEVLPKGLYQRRQIDLNAKPPMKMRPSSMMISRQSPPLILPVVPWRSQVPANIIGTAFDYALRFELARVAPGSLQTEWVAESVPDMLRNRAEHYEGKERDLRRRHPEIPLSRSSTSDFFYKASARAEFRVRNARTFFRKHLRRRNCDDSWLGRLAAHTLKLARLDAHVRAGDIEFLFEPYDQDAVREIANMLKICPVAAFSDQEPLMLNPGFGRLSEMVGGADCDMISGGSLVEIKVSSRACVEREMVRQLVVYMILADEARSAGENLPEVDRLCIYFARHGHLWHLAASKVRQQSAYADLRRWFMSMISGRDEKRSSG